LQSGVPMTVTVGFGVGVAEGFAVEVCGAAEGLAAVEPDGVLAVGAAEAD
jgi:hypothetical protein